MNILYIGPYKQVDRWGQHSYNMLGCLNSIPNINIVARSIQYNNLNRKIDDWCLKLEEKECCETYDYIFQCTIPSDFVYTPNSIGLTIIEPTTLIDRFWQRKLLEMPKVLVGSLQERLAVPNNSNIEVLPVRIDTSIKYKEYKPPDIKELGKSYIFYWIGEYGDSCYKEALQAFHLEFNRKEDVHLAMYFITQPTNESVEKIHKELQQTKIFINKYRNPTYYKEDTISVGLDIESIRSYHNYCDCYVDINRGLNNKNNIKEAQLFGKQIILNKINCDDQESIIGHPVYSPYSLWKSISISDIRRKMRNAYENRVVDEIKIERLDYSYGGKQIMKMLENLK